MFASRTKGDGLDSNLEFYQRVTLVPSMIADGVDTDELETHERREGMFGSIFWGMVKLGMSAALAGGGYLLNATGFDVDLGGDQSSRSIFLLRLCDAGIPMITSAIAMHAHPMWNGVQVSEAMTPRRSQKPDDWAGPL